MRSVATCLLLLRADGKLPACIWIRAMSERRLDPCVRVKERGGVVDRCRDRCRDAIRNDARPRRCEPTRLFYLAWTRRVVLVKYKKNEFGSGLGDLTIRVQRSGVHCLNWVFFTPARILCLFIMNGGECPPNSFLFRSPNYSSVLSTAIPPWPSTQALSSLGRY